MEINAITRDIISCAFEVRRNCGKYMLENFYKHALAYELTASGHAVALEECITCNYKGVVIKEPYRADIIVDNTVIVELKALKFLRGDEIRQLITYLKLSNLPVGMLINFGATDFCTSKIPSNGVLDKGIYRIAGSANTHL